VRRKSKLHIPKNIESGIFIANICPYPNVSSDQSIKEEKEKDKKTKRTQNNKADAASYSLLALAGIVYPLVMKSPSLICFLSASLVNRPRKFSLGPTIFCRFFFTFSSSRILAVRRAVVAFLIPDLLTEVVVGDLEGADVDGFAIEIEEVTVVAVAVVFEPSSPFVVVACFLRFFDPGAFFKE
jgi:hypothetical protein